jgi:hypothetical protein
LYPHQFRLWPNNVKSTQYKNAADAAFFFLYRVWGIALSVSFADSSPNGRAKVMRCFAYRQLAADRRPCTVYRKP